MNPSRISTPVSKQIDTWHFKFNNAVVEFRVSMLRPRDAQAQPTDKAEDSPLRKEGIPLIKFIAEISAQDIKRSGLKLGEFTPIHLEHDDINQLRTICEAHVRAMLKLNWQPVIVIGFKAQTRQNAHSTELALDNNHTREQVELSFDFIPAQRAKCLTSGSGYLYRRLGDPDDSYVPDHPRSVLHGSIASEFIHVIPFDQKILESLLELKVRYGRLNEIIADLLKPEHKERFLTALSLGNLLMMPKE